MPNPLIGSIRLNTTKKVDANRPHAVDPRPEAYTGENIPYRGTETHGVPITVGPDGFDGYEDMHSGEYEPQEPEPDPVAVRIVTQGGRELRRFRTGTEILDSTAAPIVRMIAGRNPARTQITIKNTGAGIVYIGESESVASYTGFAIAAGALQALNAEDAIYAVAAAGTTGTLSLLEEFTVRER